MGEIAVKTNPALHRESRSDTPTLAPARTARQGKQSRVASPQGEKPHPPIVDFHGASIINEQGEEIPITENMVQNAMNRYIQQWELARTMTHAATAATEE